MSYVISSDLRWPGAAHWQARPAWLVIWMDVVDMIGLMLRNAYRCLTTRSFLQWWSFDQDATQ